ncbi:MAG: hypothetical protein JWP01_2583 [Myxococcales bacterium]|nr:hypothetical protein [Myxococcales bacterium]
MWRAGWMGVFALVCAGCERAAPGPKQTDLDPCSLVTESDATALLGRPVVKQQASSGACAWAVDVPDDARSSLGLEIKDHNGPFVIVKKAEITMNGKPYVDTRDPWTVEQVPVGHGGMIKTSPSMVRVSWPHGDIRLDLTVQSAGPSTFTAASKAEQMTRLAQKVDAALR